MPSPPVNRATEISAPPRSLIFAAYTYALRKAVFSGQDADKLINRLEPQLMVVLQGLGYQDPEKD
jgi:hypothetical protein